MDGSATTLLEHVASVKEQRTLERGGWSFVRLWTSEWLVERARCTERLTAVLTTAGVRPIERAAAPAVAPVAAPDAPVAVAKAARAEQPTSSLAKPLEGDADDNAIVIADDDDDDDAIVVDDDDGPPPPRPSRKRKPPAAAASKKKNKKPRVAPSRASKTTKKRGRANSNSDDGPDESEDWEAGSDDH